jgi:hypothetical protein
MIADIEAMLLGQQGLRIYIFFREGFFYPIGLRNDDDARKNALCNPGTTKVEDIDGRVVWAHESKAEGKEARDA